MNVTLLDYTGSGQPNPAHYAAAILAFTKNTRLNMTAGSLFEWIVKPWEELEAELRYMANTIPSSWEFVDYTFQIEGVTRAFTHQLVRTRTASYAQQTMRVLDVSEGPGWDFLTGPSLLANPVAKEKYELAMAEIADVYKELTRGAGVKTEDARGILPTNILTNITVKMNMRTFVEMVRKRSSSRTQGEYRDVLDAL
jgi:flavin-dependent thymidylate synthase